MFFFGGEGWLVFCFVFFFRHKCTCTQATNTHIHAHARACTHTLHTYRSARITMGSVRAEEGRGLCRPVPCSCKPYEQTLTILQDESQKDGKKYLHVKSDSFLPILFGVTNTTVNCCTARHDDTGTEINTVQASWLSQDGGGTPRAPC